MSEEMVRNCYQNLASLSGDPDSSEMVRATAASVKNAVKLGWPDSNLVAAVAGCTGYGEIFIVDTRTDSVTVRSEMINFPTHYASLALGPDFDCDGTPELLLYLGTGSHGMYLVVIRVSETKIESIKLENGQDKLYAPGGRIVFKDLNGDNVPEVTLQSMPGRNDSVSSTSYTVCSFKDSCFVRKPDMDFVR